MVQIIDSEQPRPAGPSKPPRFPRLQALAAFLLMLVGVLAVYCPPALWSPDTTLHAMDFEQLHSFRISYATQSLRAGTGLPAWHSRELLGSPFWANVQAFPFIPNRLLILPLGPWRGLVVGVNLAAALAAAFTFAYCRRIGMGPLASAVSGWTFACSAYFASRITAGHLPLLEAYGALPLLLWLIERLIQSPPIDRRRWAKILSLGLSATCVALAGHPQLPFYALGIAGLYALTRGALVRRAQAMAALALGVACAAFVLLPMYLLIGRSTRVLDLNPPRNNVFLEYDKLSGFYAPNPEAVKELSTPEPPRLPGEPAPRADRSARFWDSFCYVGAGPLIGLLLVPALQLSGGKKLRGPWIFFSIVGLLALLLALPLSEPLYAMVKGTMLRSPVRQLYITVFALSLVMGAGVQVVLAAWPRPAWAGLAIALGVTALHVWDLSSISGNRSVFVQVVPAPTAPPEAMKQARAQVADGRTAIDINLHTPLNRELDDIGFFDSIMLARPYRALLAMSNADPRLNEQFVNGRRLSTRALAYAAVRLVITPDSAFAQRRTELSPAGPSVFLVPNPARRIGFLVPEQARFVPDSEALNLLRDPAVDLANTILLPPDARPVASAAPTSLPADLRASIGYDRPSPDSIILPTQVPLPGYVRIIESWDPGWSATIDGQPAPVLVADTFTMAVAVPAGKHDLRLTYRTPGATAGASTSFAAIIALAALAFTSQRRLQPPAPAPAPVDSPVSRQITDP